MNVPATAQAAAQALGAARIPGPVLEVALELKRAGHAAVFVGGAVRDFLLGRPADDWDLASSATPDEVMKVFRHTIPTGVEHGTVTVMVGPKGSRVGVEVTTFRGEGEYVDGRRPSSVQFLRELDDDLARRDFTINAFAWDPPSGDQPGQFVDRFGGLEDLLARRVRAVGDAVVRFEEDGLRTMRAVRFCATLGFSLEPRTLAAIPLRLHVFDKVARERVRVELFKLLRSVDVRAGLAPMASSRLWPRVFGYEPGGDEPAIIGAIEGLRPDPVLRLARLLRDRPASERAKTLDALKLSKDDRRLIDLCLSDWGRGLRGAISAGERPFRMAARHIGRDALEPCVALADDSLQARTQALGWVEDVPLSSKELAIKGRDLIDAGICEPGPALGMTLKTLLVWALEEPGRNTPEKLLEAARDL